MNKPSDDHDHDSLNALLDQHAWPSMPEETHVRLRAALAPRLHYGWMVRRLPVAAALLIGISLGVAIPRPAAAPDHPSDPLAFDLPPARHVIVTRAVFNGAGPDGVRPADPSRWSTIAPR